VTQQAGEPNDIGRNFLLGNRKQTAKFLMRTFTCRSTFLYALNLLFLHLLSRFIILTFTFLPFSAAYLSPLLFSQQFILSSLHQQCGCD
jgi:hypothetical protein